MKYLEKTHDLRLPNWGPYTKKYMGISHLPAKNKGLRFDLSVFPGFYRRKVQIPNVNWESGYHPWEATGDLKYFAHRHELEWKDRVYCDISFAYRNESARLIRCACVNTTENQQNLVLHYMASMNFPSVRGFQILGPEEMVVKDGLDYQKLEYATSRPTDSLMPDGLLRGEERGEGFVDGSGLGRGFGKEKGDSVEYCIELKDPLENAAVIFRFRLHEGEVGAFACKGILEGKLEMTGQDGFKTKTINVGDLRAGEHSLVLNSLGKAAVEIDSFVVVSDDKRCQVEFEPVENNPYPRITAGPEANSLLLKYECTDMYYGLTWGFFDFEVREFHTGELDRFMRYTVHNHVRKVLKGQGEGHFTNAFMRPIPIQPQQKRVIYGLVAAGTSEEVNAELAGFDGNSISCEETFEEARKDVVDITGKGEGKRYAFSQQRMAATTLTNVVYPTYIRRSYIKHFTPGRWWDSLYTWDSGFIGIGLAELNIERAVDCLNAYVTEPGDPHAAFIHHGTPLPVQIYLFQKLWNRTQSHDLLKHFYPRLRKYYAFLAGKLGSSTTGELESDLLKTWDYFYNSGGWDDYPPQVHVHQNRLTGSVTPVCTTAHCIRSAKILKLAALTLGLGGDIREYEMDIERFSEAIHKNCWDEESGYFGYLRHDESGYPVEILRHESGANFNMGLDGASPLIADICSPDQERRLKGHLRSEDHLWTPIGLSAVDRSAPYFRRDGYWNGSVWMPHQWFFWKTMLDLGEDELAHRIAETGLEVWKREVDTSYNCFEHFIIETGRGAGWHHFGGLSTPVLAWFAAYYRPGRLTVGFNTWINSKEFSDENSSLKASLNTCGKPDQKCTLIAAMNPNHTYRVLWNGVEADFREKPKGTLHISLRSNQSPGELVVVPCRQ